MLDKVDCFFISLAQSVEDKVGVITICWLFNYAAIISEFGHLYSASTVASIIAKTISGMSLLFAMCLFWIVAKLVLARKADNKTELILIAHDCRLLFLAAFVIVLVLWSSFFSVAYAGLMASIFYLLSTEKKPPKKQSNKSKPQSVFN